MRGAICLLVLISCALPTSAVEAGLVRIGAVELQYDQALWTIERAADGGLTRLVSVPEWREKVDVAVEIVPEPVARCDLASERERLDRAIQWFDMHDENYAPISVAATDLDVHGVMARLGCANWASHSVAACVRHGGVLHRFTYLAEGCETGPEGEERVIKLLSGLRPAE